MDQVRIIEYPLLNAYVFGAFSENSGLGIRKFESLRLTTDRLWAMWAERELKEAGLIWGSAFDAGYQDCEQCETEEYTGRFPRANEVTGRFF